MLVTHPPPDQELLPTRIIPNSEGGFPILWGILPSARTVREAKIDGNGSSMKFADRKK